MQTALPKLMLINGPNLDCIEVRDPALYGVSSLNDITQKCQSIAQQNGFNLSCYQSAHEGQLIEWVHEARSTCCGLIINAGGYSHTSIALMDAVSTLKIPVIDVHLSNIYARESYRQTSYIAKVSTGTIAGFAENSYILAMQALINLIKKP